MRRNLTALYHTLPKEKRAIGHSLYEGIPGKVAITQEEQSRDPKKCIGRAKNMQDILHTRMTSYNLFCQHFCHGKAKQNTMDLHQMCVEAVCVVVW